MVTSDSESSWGTHVLLCGVKWHTESSSWGFKGVQDYSHTWWHLFTLSGRWMLASFLIIFLFCLCYLCAFLNGICLWSKTSFVSLLFYCFLCVILHVLLVDLNVEVFHGYVVLWVERADEVEGTWREHTKQKRVTLVPEMKS